jgi:type IX secretion system PorP/SprF family membrane protein
MRHNLAIIIIFSATTVYGQDLHFSQFYLNPATITPAAPAMERGDMRAAGLYRSQWQSVPVAYETFSGSFDYTAARSGGSLLRLGLQLQQDKAGDGGLEWLQAGLNAAVGQQISARHRLGAGFGLSLVQRRVQVGNLTFQNQWGGDSFDPSLPSKESFPAASGVSPSVSAGICWQYTAETGRNSTVAGAGLSHINRPDVGFEAGANRLPARTGVYVHSVIEAGEMADAVLFGTWQHMASAREILLGAGYRRILTTGTGNYTAVQLAVANRINDALIPSVQVERNNWILGVSYDFNISSFNTATTGRGGMEIALVWNRIPVPLLNNTRTCPVF